MKPEKMRSQCVEVASILKAVAHPERLMILCHLAEGERNVSEITALSGTSQSQVSQFLNRMHREKLLRSRKEGKFSYYAIADARLRKLLQAMQSIFCE